MINRPRLQELFVNKIWSQKAGPALQTRSSSQIQRSQTRYMRSATQGFGLNAWRNTVLTYEGHTFGGSCKKTSPVWRRRLKFSTLPSAVKPAYPHKACSHLSM